MLISRITRPDLVGLGERKEWEIEESTVWPELQSQSEHIIIWSAWDRHIPAAILVPTTLEDFFAWSGTYLQHLTPISSALRILTDAPNVTTYRRHEAFGVFGLVFAELEAWNLASQDSERTEIQRLRGTLSFALLQSRSSQGSDLRQIAENWLEARRLLRLPEPPFAPEDVVDVWATTNNQSTANSDEPRSWPTHNDDPSQLSLENIRISMDVGAGPLEDRVRRFKELRSTVDVDPRGLGRALSQISQGSFRHAHLVGPRFVRSVRTLLWYGWFDANEAQHRGVPWFGGRDGLILRAECQSILEKPDTGEFADIRRLAVDVSLPELRVLLRAKNGRNPVKPKDASLVRMDLGRGVVSEFALPEDVPLTRSRPRKR